VKGGFVATNDQMNDQKDAQRNDPKFESRKKDHITQSLNVENQVGLSPSDQIQLFHKALPEINFEEVTLMTTILGSVNLSAPLFVSSMTAGHQEGQKLNYTLAKACAAKNWLFAVGSQRKQLTDSKKNEEWSNILKDFPNLNLVGNLGLTQLISFGPDPILNLIESLKAKAIFIHTNPIQEVLQLEGTPQFKNGFKALESLCSLSPVPVLIKETGCGFDSDTLLKLFKIPNLYAVDVAGFGGTHWGRVEGHRNAMNTLEMKSTESADSHSSVLDQSHKLISKKDLLINASQTYANWGISTAKVLEQCELLSKDLHSKTKYWASGGIRSGLDIVTCLSMGAEMVGVAQPILKQALMGYDSLIQYMELLEFETKIGLFCTGFKNVSSCQKDARWEWKK
jgi:isopentenyl-diphosphate Delta-isomerase